MSDETVLRTNLGKDASKLGKKVAYVSRYKPSLLDSLPRNKQRHSLGITADALPFRGMDTWNAYEFTWLNESGKPEVALARIQVPAKSANIIESKSLKLYLGSYSNTKFTRRAEVIATLEADLTLAVQAPVSITLLSPEQTHQNGIGVLMGQCIDHLDVAIDEYYWSPDFLKLKSDTIVRESVHSHLFRSLCPVTGQPDFASIGIQYNGRNISQEGLLKYLISYREHTEFGEQIVERIFVDIMNRCTPDRLQVVARFTRRGGIDLNASRSHDSEMAGDVRVWRQ